MKILKYGEGYPKTVICNDCKSELEYGLEDMDSYHWVYTDKVEFIKTIKCPVCGKEITVDKHIDYYSQPETRIESEPKSETQPKKRWWQK